jgi:hypothetical protein
VRRRRLQDSFTRLYLVVNGPYDRTVWDKPDEDDVSWASLETMVDLLDLETGTVEAVNVAGLRELEGAWRLLE